MYRYIAVGLVLPLAYAAWRTCRRYSAGPREFWPFLAAVALCGLSAVLVAPDPATLLASIVLGWTLVVLAAVDLRIRRLPDVLTLPLVAAGLAQAALLSPQQLADRLIGAAVGYGLLAGVAVVYRRVRGRDGLGLGDAKLLAAAGAWLGWRPLPQVLLIGSVCGLAWALYSRRRTGGAADAPLAFGPWLALGTWVCWLVLARA